MYASGTRSVSMPSRAYTSFLPNKPVKITDAKSGVNALSGLYLISTRNCLMEGSAEIIVSMPSRAYTSFLQSRCDQKYVLPGHRVSMPSRAYTSFLLRYYLVYLIIRLVSMPSRAYTSFLLLEDGSTAELDTISCQCPLGLIPHFYSTPSKT